MALGAAVVWEVRTTGASANSGGFNVGNTNLPTDLAATSATGSSPVVTSASYTFVAGDVGYLVFIKSGTNWTPGFYPIASVSAGAATLNAAIGAVVLYGGATVLNTVAGCATTASPTGGTWGCDYSQNASARFSFTDMVIDGTTNTKFTSAANPVGKNMVGNLINVASGTGFTVQWVEVVSTLTTTATADKSLGTLSSTGGTGNLGGALLKFSDVAAVMTTSNWAFVQAGSGYSSTATTTFGAAGVTPTATARPNRITGYTTYRGDGGRAVLTLATNTGLTGLSFTNRGWLVENIAVDCGSLGTSTGFSVPQFSWMNNCKVSNFKTNGVTTTNGNTVIAGCEVTGGLSGATSAINAIFGNLYIHGCNIHDNVCPGILPGGQFVTIADNLITNNTGASSDGIGFSNGGGGMIRSNTLYGNGRDAVSWRIGGGPGTSLIIKNNIFSTNGGYGIHGNTAGWPASVNFDGNAYYLNTSGTRFDMDDVGAVNVLDGVAPYVNTLDVILSADPFTDKANNDYRLNATAGGGAACRGFGVPRSWPGNSLTTSAPDQGAAQHTDSGGGGTILSRVRTGF